MAGILSGPNTFEAFSCLVAAFNSGDVKEVVLMFKPEPPPSTDGRTLKFQVNVPLT